VAARAPLKAIVAHVLSSHQDDDANSSTAICSACNLLVTSRGFHQAVSDCQGVVPIDYSPTTPEAAAVFASELSEDALHLRMPQ
jgi:hypothetical protein